MNHSRRDLTEGGIVRNIGHLALPMMIGNVLQNAFSIVDMIFVGRLGPSAIAAVGMSGVVLGFLFVVIIGIYTGTVALVARFIGAKNPSEAENVAMQSLFLGGFCYAAIAIMGYPLAPFILRVLGGTEEVVGQGVPYIRIMFLGSFAMIFTVVLSSVLRAAGDAITPLKILTLATVLNIGLDPLLIFGWGPFPRLGVAGSALATVIARGLGAALLLWIFLRGNGVIHLKIARARIDLPLLGRIIRIGIFASIQGILRNISGVVLTRLVAMYGTYAVAAYMIGMRLQMMVMMSAFGLAGAVATLVGQNLGAHKPERAARTAWITVGVGFAIMTVLGIFYIVFSRSIIGVFNKDPEVLRIGMQYLRICAGAFGFIGLSIILGRALSGAGDTVSPMVITAIGLLGIRLALSLLFSWKLGLTGIWLGITASTIIQGLMVGVWFHTGRWKLKRV
ncbi:MAG: MATE family efflux transporter [Candidatus Latescibacteria bacterium]|nr:MATE family efflux transporter [Candidatus Latescibacterota bacterium]